VWKNYQIPTNLFLFQVGERIKIWQVNKKKTEKSIMFGCGELKRKERRRK
jgi:hypothetical protein